MVQLGKILFKLCLDLSNCKLVKPVLPAEAVSYMYLVVKSHNIQSRLYSPNGTRTSVEDIKQKMSKI